jgi:hypothetical protein
MIGANGGQALGKPAGCARSEAGGEHDDSAAAGARVCNPEGLCRQRHAEVPSDKMPT